MEYMNIHWIKFNLSNLSTYFYNGKTLKYDDLKLSRALSNCVLLSCVIAFSVAEKC